MSLNSRVQYTRTATPSRVQVSTPAPSPTMAMEQEIRGRNKKPGADIGRRKTAEGAGGGYTWSTYLTCDRSYKQQRTLSLLPHRSLHRSSPPSYHRPALKQMQYINIKSLGYTRILEPSLKQNSSICTTLTLTLTLTLLP